MDNPKTNPSLDNEEKIQFQKRVTYPPVEDIYNQSENLVDINPENITAFKEPNEQEVDEEENEKDFDEDISGSDLDIPGAELDDEEEEVGSEDEENNYYSIGGDDHNELDEDKGE
jgi:hypothetical protein